MIGNNDTYRDLIQSNKDAYGTTRSNKDKSNIKDKIFATIESTHTPGKLMKRRDVKPRLKVWLEVAPIDRSEKIGQDLRESRKNPNYGGIGAIGRALPIRLPRPQDQVGSSMLELVGQVIGLCSSYNGSMALINYTLRLNAPVEQARPMINNANQAPQRGNMAVAPVAQARNVPGAANESAGNQAPSGNNNQKRQRDNVGIPSSIEFATKRRTSSANIPTSLDQAVHGVNSHPLLHPNLTFNQRPAMRPSQQGQILHHVDYNRVIRRQLPAPGVLSLVGGINNQVLPSNATNNQAPAVPAQPPQRVAQVHGSANNNQAPVVPAQPSHRVAQVHGSMNTNQGLTSNATNNQVHAVLAQAYQQAGLLRAVGNNHQANAVLVQGFQQAALLLTGGNNHQANAVLAQLSQQLTLLLTGGNNHQAHAVLAQLSQQLTLLQGGGNNNQGLTSNATNGQVAVSQGQSSHQAPPVQGDVDNAYNRRSNVDQGRDGLIHLTSSGDHVIAPRPSSPGHSQTQHQPPSLPPGNNDRTDRQLPPGNN